MVCWLSRTSSAAAALSRANVRALHSPLTTVVATSRQPARMNRAWRWRRGIAVPPRDALRASGKPVHFALAEQGGHVDPQDAGRGLVGGGAGDDPGQML